MDQSKSAAGAAALLLACVFAVSTAFADAPDGQVRIEDIKFQDLNLATTAGVDALDKRIHAAALRVCADPTWVLRGPRRSAVRTRRLGLSKN